MLWMNESEIDQAADRYQAHPVLGPATKLLQRFRDLIDSVSDGWCYWRQPAQAAHPLTYCIQHPDYATEANCRKAVIPIKAFCTRHKLKFPADVPIAADRPYACDPLQLLESLLSITECFTPRMSPAGRKEWQRISAETADLRLLAENERASC